MQCLGRTKSLHRCKKSARFVCCEQHRYQPLSLLFFLLSLSVTAFSFTKEVFFPIQSYLSAADFSDFSQQDELIRAKAQKLIEMNVINSDADMIALALFDARTRKGIAFASTKNETASEYLDQILEPGTIVTPILVAAALDTGLINPGSILKMKDIPGYEIKDHYNFSEFLNIEDVIVRSSNRAAIAVGQALGPINQTKFLNRTSFPVEPIENTKHAPIEIMAHSYGYGFRSSPRNIVKAYSHLLDGESQSLFKEETKTIVRLLLEDVTGMSGTAPLTAALRQTIAAKTSTVQIGYSNLGEPTINRPYRGTMIAMFPALHPKYIAIVTVLNPKRLGPYAGVHCGPIVRELAGIAFGVETRMPVNMKDHEESF